MSNDTRDGLSDWMVFQQDVLDLLRQYQGFFDFFERVGSLSDDSRPDCVARISRDNKKEVWVLDAKNKPEVDEDDLGRMEKYIDMMESNPIDLGLEISEISDYTFRGIFVTSRGEIDLEEYEQVAFNSLHQLLQKELIYTDTDRVVRDVAKMMERRTLSQSQARLLFSSIKPFEARLNRVLEHLEELETKYVGLELEKPPLDSEFNVPVDAILRHPERGKTFLIDIPYSLEALHDIESKVEEVRRRIDSIDENIYYAAINTFDPIEGPYIYSIEELESEIQQTAGIISPDNLVELFRPKLSVNKEFGENYTELKDDQGIGFRMRVSSTDDVKHRVEIVMALEAASRMKENMANTRKELGDVRGNSFSMELEITPDLEVKYNGKKESWASFKDTINSVYQSAVNPELSKKIREMV